MYDIPHFSRGWYAVYPTTIDMLRDTNVLYIGKAHTKLSRGGYSSQKYLNYVSHKGEDVRLYDTRRLHSWVSDDDVRDKFPQFFI